MNFPSPLAGNKRILLKKRYSYFKFIKLLNGSQFVISDGGSNQEELSYMGKPTLLFRRVTERIEGLKENVIISNFEMGKVLDFVENYKKFESPAKQVPISPSKIIVNYLRNSSLNPKNG